MWRIDEDAEWQKFQPTKPVAKFNVTVFSDEYFEMYLKREDYFQLPEIMEQGYGSALATINLALVRAHQNHDLGSLSYAIIEACNALELTLSYRIRNVYSDSDKIKQARQTFFNLPKESQLIYLASVDGTIAEKDLELAISAIKLRNKIVHDGFEPSSDKCTHDKIDALIRVTAHFLPGPPMRFPCSNPGNKLVPKRVFSIYNTINGPVENSALFVNITG